MKEVEEEEEEGPAGGFPAWGEGDEAGGVTEGEEEGAAGESPVLELVELERRFGETVAVDGLSLRIGEGELVTLLGPSGCGKTTVLRLVAGFETPDAGRVRFRGEDMTGWTPRRRGFGMVFQNYALFPHLDVFENVAFGLRSRSRPEEEIRRRVARALELVDLPGFGERRVQQLSGGQQQRVAVARALAIEPPLLLLDEPLSNLDAALRERTRTELRLLVKELGITTLFVTHDQEEAFDLSDRVAVMREGRIRQVGTPEELYDAPGDPFVAGFVGRANRLPVRVKGRAGEWVAVLEDGTAWPLAGGSVSPGGERATGGGGRVQEPGEGDDRRQLELWIRPEDLRIVPAEGEADEGMSPGVDLLRGVVRDRRFRGAVTVYRVEIASGRLVEVAGPRDAAAPGDRVGVRPRTEPRMHLFPASGEASGSHPRGGGEPPISSEEPGSPASGGGQGG